MSSVEPLDAEVVEVDRAPEGSSVEPLDAEAVEVDRVVEEAGPGARQRVAHGVAAVRVDEEEDAPAAPRAADLAGRRAGRGFDDDVTLAVVDVREQAPRALPTATGSD